MAETKKRRIAAADLPVMEATLKQLFKFQTLEQALGRLNQIREEFEIAHVQETEDGPVVKLWVKGFSLTDEELKKGALGNYALIRPRKVQEGHFILHAEKQDVDVSKHPQRARPQQKHPNWGHPVLRAVKKKKQYDTLLEAQGELDLLHREYPETTIPGEAKLHLMIYQKPGDGQKGPPIKKAILEIKNQGNKFIIAAKDNERTGKPKNQRPLPGAQGNEPSYTTPKGQFTAMVELKRAKKRKGNSIKIKPQFAEGEEPDSGSGENS